MTEPHTSSSLKTSEKATPSEACRCHEPTEAVHIEVEGCQCHHDAGLRFPEEQTRADKLAALLSAPKTAAPASEAPRAKSSEGIGRATWRAAVLLPVLLLGVVLALSVLTPVLFATLVLFLPAVAPIIIIGLGIAAIQDAEKFAATPESAVGPSPAALQANSPRSLAKV